MSDSINLQMSPAVEEALRADMILVHQLYYGLDVGLIAGDDALTAVGLDVAAVADLVDHTGAAQAWRAAHLPSQDCPAWCTLPAGHLYEARYPGEPRTRHHTARIGTVTTEAGQTVHVELLAEEVDDQVGEVIGDIIDRIEPPLTPGDLQRLSDLLALAALRLAEIRGDLR